MQSQNLSLDEVLWECKIERWNAPKHGLQQKLNGLLNVNVLGICIKIYYLIIFALIKACLCRIEEHTWECDDKFSSLGTDMNESWPSKAFGS